MDHQNEIEQFATWLRQARRTGGNPSYRELTRHMDYSLSTISRVMTGKTFPTWSFTEQFLRACRVPEPRAAGRWHTRWLKVAELVSPVGGDFPYDDEAGQDETAPQPPAGTECPECGALILNPLRHQAWHMSYVRREPARRADLRRLSS